MNCFALFITLTLHALSLWKFANTFVVEDFVEPGIKVKPDDDLLRRSTSPRTLLIVGSPTWTTEHGEFIQTLKLSGHQLVEHPYYHSNHVAPIIFKYDHVLYDNIILASLNPDSLKQTTEFNNNLEKFVSEACGNILVLGGSLTLFSSSFFSALRIKMLSAHPVKDFISNINRNPYKVISKQVSLSESIMSADLRDKGVLFQGPALVQSQTNALQFSFLSHEPTTLLPSKDNVLTLQKSRTLVVALQTRDNARVVVTGSSNLCSDATFSEHLPNAKFCDEMAQWTFKQRGVIDWSNVVHKSVETQKSKDSYVIHEEIEFSVDLHQLKTTSLPDTLHNVSLRWAPVDPSVRNHFQMEHRMLHPYWRLDFDLQKEHQTGTRFSVRFKCADRHGVYKIVALFVQKGYTFVQLEVITPVRTPFHDDYKKFPWIAAPHYASSIVSLILSLAVVAVVSYGKTS